MKQLIETKSMVEKLALLLHIKIVGIGNSGKEIIDYLIETGERKTDYFIIDTKEIENSTPLVENIILEEKEDSEANRLRIKSFLEGSNIYEKTDMLIVTLRTSDRDSFRLALLVAKISKDMGILTILVSSDFWNPKIEEEKLNDSFDAIVPIKECFFLKENKKEISFEKVNEAIKMAIKGMTDLNQYLSVIGYDFADMKIMMTDSGIAKIGYGEAEGDDRAKIATKEALNHPLLENSIKKARKVIMTIKASSQLGLTEAYAISNMVKDEINRPNDVMFVVLTNDDLEDTIQVIILATNFTDDEIVNEEFIENEDLENIDEFDEELEIPKWMRVKNKDI